MFLELLLGRNELARRFMLREVLELAKYGTVAGEATASANLCPGIEAHATLRNHWLPWFLSVFRRIFGIRGF